VVGGKFAIAQVRLDGALLDKLTPLTIDNILPGTHHRIELVMVAYPSQLKEVDSPEDGQPSTVEARFFPRSAEVRG
jgi:hypothetical protein